MEVEHLNGSIKKQYGEISDLLEGAKEELKKDDVRSVKIVKPMNTFPRKRKRRKRRK